MKQVKNIAIHCVFLVATGFGFSVFGTPPGPMVMIDKMPTEQPVKHVNDWLSREEKWQLTLIDSKIKESMGPLDSVYSEEKWKKLIDNNDRLQRKMLREKYLYSENKNMQSAVVKGLKLAKLDIIAQTELILLLTLVIEDNSKPLESVGRKGKVHSISEAVSRPTLIEQILLVHAPRLEMDAQQNLLMLLAPSFTKTDPVRFVPVQKAAERIIIEAARNLSPENHRAFVGMLFKDIVLEAYSGNIAPGVSQAEIDSNQVEVKKIEEILMKMTKNLASDAQTMLVNHLFSLSGDRAQEMKEMIKRVLLQIPKPHILAQKRLKQLVSKKQESQQQMSSEGQAFIDTFLRKTPSWAPAPHLTIGGKFEQTLSSVVERCRRTFL